MILSSGQPEQTEFGLQPFQNHPTSRRLSQMPSLLFDLQYRRAARIPIPINCGNRDDVRRRLAQG